MTERFLFNDGTGTAMTVKQAGDYGVADFVDKHGDTVLTIKNDGKIGINVEYLTEALTVDGNTSLNSNLYASNVYINGPHFHVLRRHNPRTK